MLICCGKRHKGIIYMCEPPVGYVFQRIEFLSRCKHCKRTVMEVVKTTVEGEEVRFRRTDADAYKLFESMRPSILYRLDSFGRVQGGASGFWLGYSEFGRKKKCFSNFSALKNVGESLFLDGFTRLTELKCRQSAV